MYRCSRRRGTSVVQPQPIVTIRASRPDQRHQTPSIWVNSWRIERIVVLTGNGLPRLGDGGWRKRELNAQRKPDLNVEALHGGHVLLNGLLLIGRAKSTAVQIADKVVVGGQRRLWIRVGKPAAPRRKKIGLPHPSRNSGKPLLFVSPISESLNCDWTSGPESITIM